MDASDAELIRSFARQGSHEAFATLVQRHVDLVYSAARRQLYSQHLAEQATQLVFIALVRTPPKLDAAAALAPWLIAMTRQIAVVLLKREGRRPASERPSFETVGANAPAEWVRIEPLLDDAMMSLDQADSTALLLRYFETKDLRAVGGALGITEGAAQKRISHALDALREVLRRRGIEITTGDLSANLSAYGVELAPPALAQTVTAGALGGGAAAAALPPGAVRLSGSERAIIVAALVLGLGGIAFQSVTLARAHATVVRLQSENDELVAQVRTTEEQRRVAAMAAEAAQPAVPLPAAASAGSGTGPAPSRPAKR